MLPNLLISVLLADEMTIIGDVLSKNSIFEDRDAVALPIPRLPRESSRELEVRMVKFWQNHPILVAVAAIAVIYAITFGWRHPVDFIGTLAVLAFAETGIASAEIEKLKTRVHELEDSTR